jgi:hypothetical protein
MSLIHDIQAAAISQTTDVPTLLRMCKLLAARISSRELAAWVEHELNGYPTVDALPDYRVVQVDSYGTFIGPFSKANKLQIPVSTLPVELQEQYQHAYMGASISVYVGLLEGGTGGSVQEAWPVGLAVHHASKIASQMQCIAAWKEIPLGAIVRLLDSVKTRVLGFAIDLERESPDAGELPIGSQPTVSPEKMTQIFNTNIAGHVGNLSNAGTSVSQSAVIQVMPGDWQSLQGRLAELGLSHQDLEGLQADLDRASAADTASKSQTASSWIGRLTGKAAAGAAGIGVEVAAAGIAKAIAAYLGLPGA